MDENAPKKFTCYYRISTQKQSDSGLGLEAQKATVRDYVSKQGGVIVGEYVEVETGKLAERPILANAMGHARRAKATLVVAKLDRLARNVAFTSALMRGNVEFVCCDNPHANKFTIHILAAVAEHEAEMISKRTKEALKAAKARGVLLGSNRVDFWKGKEHLRQAGLAKARIAAKKLQSKAAREAYTDLYEPIREMMRMGWGERKICTELNKRGYKSRTGKPFCRAQMRNIMNYAMEQQGVAG